MQMSWQHPYALIQVHSPEYQFPAEERLEEIRHLRRCLPVVFWNALSRYAKEVGMGQTGQPKKHEVRKHEAHDGEWP
jgi:hypothetical protein